MWGDAVAATIILALGIGLYAVWVIKKKVKDAKNGKFCSCGCAGCPGSCGKPIQKEEEKEVI